MDFRDNSLEMLKFPTNFRDNSLEMLKFRSELVNDSVFLKNMCETYSDDEYLEIIETLPTDYNLVVLLKMYTKNYDFNETEFIILIEQLNYLDNKYLDDILVLAKLQKSRYIENNLQEDVLIKYHDLIVDTPFETFLARDNLDILIWIKEKENITIGHLTFIHACKYSNIKVISWLYSFQTINSKRTEFSWTAARYGNLDAMYFLILHGLEIKNNSILLELASENGQTDVVIFLLQYVTDRKKINSSLNGAIISGTLSLVKYFIDFMLGKNIEIKIETESIKLAVENGYSEVCKYLTDYITPFLLKVMLKIIVLARVNLNFKINLDLVELILVKYNNISLEFLQTALHNKDLELFKLLLNYETPISLNLNSLFIVKNYTSIVASFINILISYNMSYKLINAATLNYHFEYVKYIYDNSPKKPNLDKALEMACNSNNIVVVRYLIGKGAVANDELIIFCVSNGIDDAIVELLINNKSSNNGLLLKITHEYLNDTITFEYYKYIFKILSKCNLNQDEISTAIKLLNENSFLNNMDAQKQLKSLLI